MARVMAFDYGRKRVGVAVTDSLQIIANGLDTIETKNIKIFLKEYLAKEEVQAFVMGIPYNKKYEENDIVKDIEVFIQWLVQQYPDKPIHRIDERFTSKMATQAILMSGVNKKARQVKATVDKVSATIILQSFLERKI
jgi:putative Holliday junction resolvase